MWRWDTYEEFKEKHGPKSNLRDWSEFFAVGNYLENIGLLLKRGLLDKSYIDDLISGDIIGYWDRFEPVIKGIRTEYNWPQYNEWVEYLYNIVKPLVAEQHPEIDANRMMKP